MVCTTEHSVKLKKTEYKITRVSDKLNIKEYVETLNTMADNTIEEVISYADESGICKKDDRINIYVGE